VISGFFFGGIDVVASQWRALALAGQLEALSKNWLRQFLVSGRAGRLLEGAILERKKKAMNKCSCRNDTNTGTLLEKKRKRQGASTIVK